MDFGDTARADGFRAGAAASSPERTPPKKRPHQQSADELGLAAGQHSPALVPSASGSDGRRLCSTQHGTTPGGATQPQSEAPATPPSSPPPLRSPPTATKTAPAGLRRSAASESPESTATATTSSGSSPWTTSTSTREGSDAAWDLRTPSAPSPGRSSTRGKAASARRLDFSRSAKEKSTASVQDIQRPLLCDVATDLHSCRSVEQRVYWEGFFVVLPVFCGYATLFGMQHDIKRSFGIEDDGSAASYEFSFAISTVYLGNLILRFGHKVVFCCMSPRGRVFFAMASMMTSMLTIALLIFTLEWRGLQWVVLSYSLGGCAVGTFEANILGCLTPLGHETKQIAITAIPAGISCILICGFFSMGPPVNLPPVAIYVGVAILNFCGMLVMATRIPATTPGGLGDHCGADKRASLRKLRSDFGNAKRWYPQIWHYAVASTIDMFLLSAFAPGVLPYVYNGEFVQITPGLTMKTDSFMAVTNVGNLCGGLAGRWLSYQLKPRHPLIYSLCSIAGVSVLLTWRPVLAPFGMFFLMMGDGLIYGTVSKYIDTTIPAEFNLVAISTWLFIGDFGAVLGSSLTVCIKEYLVG